MKSSINKEIHNLKTFILTPIITVLFFGGVFFLVNLSFNKFEQGKLRQAEELFKSGIQSDLDYLKREGDQVATNELLKKDLIERNFPPLLSTLIGEKNERNIGLMGVADEQGYIVSRTKSITQTGENALLDSPQGRAVKASDLTVGSVEQSSFDPRQVLMTTGRKIYDDNKKMIGALFANYLLDDTYAANFNNKYLQQTNVETNVIFYTAYYGAYGSSFDEKLREDLKTYLDINPDIIKSEKVNFKISINDKSYLIKKIPLKGHEASATGGLVFVSILSPIQRIIISILMGAIVLFMYLSFRHFVKFHLK